MAAAALALAAESAVRIQPADLPAILWSRGGVCPRAPELAERQCRAVRAARARSLAGKVFVVAGDQGALERDASGYTVRGCIDCAGAAAIVTGGGGVTVSGDQVAGPVLYRGPGALPAAAPRPSADCPAAPVAAVSPLPAQPAPVDLKAAMDAVAPDVESCFDRYGVPGTADVFVEIGAEGDVTYAETRGAYLDSPTGACVTSAVMKARFPRYARTPVRIHYPFLLR